MIKLTLGDAIEKCKMNDRNAHSFLYNKYHKSILTIAKRYSKTIEDAEDAMNESFIKIFDNIHSFYGSDTEKTFFSWVYTIVKNTAIHNLRYNKVHNPAVQLEDKCYNIADMNNIHSKINYDTLNMHIDFLPRKQRRIFNLHAVEGYKHHEIAMMMNISEGTSKSQFARAKGKLQEKITR